MAVDINTKMIVLLGKPLSQSYAARMQNAAYKAANLNMLYFYSEVENDHLEDVVNGLKYLSFAGFAVTKPNKVEIMKYVDEKDPLCEKMNASNTVVILPDGKLKAYNTDGIGFFRAFREEVPEVDVNETTFFCLGAGGAARAICSVLAYNNAKKIYIANRTLSKGQDLVDDINKNFSEIAELVDFDDAEDMKKKIEESGVIMNNTGLGMLTSIDSTPIPKEYLKKDQICFDATYNPAKTKFLTDAEIVGCKIINGLGMSLHQGAEQIELWSGKQAPVEVMQKELLNIIAGIKEE
ncbi:MAG: shikimate dehydrogenase [Gudongella sp.]|nr:shikimate dehydrogenase [Gudongella sp.]